METKVGKTYYRYDTHSYDEYIEQFYVEEFLVTKVTPCGVWLLVWGKKKFVLTKATKKFAFLTKEEALTSFIARKTRQLEILEAQKVRVQIALKAAKTHSVEDTKPLLLNYYFSD